MAGGFVFANNVLQASMFQGVVNGGVRGLCLDAAPASSAFAVGVPLAYRASPLAVAYDHTKS